jgi:hypothetical protein
MVDLPDISTIDTTHPIAKKEYVCVECHKPIKKGERYWYYSAYYPQLRNWESSKTCLKCEKIRKLAEGKYLPYEDEIPLFGELYHWIKCQKGLA